MEPSGTKYLVRLPVSGGTERVAVPAAGVSEAQLAALLQTDVTERMRLQEMPDAFSGRFALCYFIDARGGEKSGLAMAGCKYMAFAVEETPRFCYDG